MTEILAFAKAFCSAIKVIGWPAAFLLGIYFCIKYPEKIQIWISLLERYFGLISSKRKRKNISNEIEGRINSFAKKINSETGNVFPYGIKLQWVEDLSDDFDREAFVKENQVIIKMKPHQNQDRNLAIATLDYVSKSLIPEGRVYVSKNTMRSIDFKMVHKMLSSNRLHSAVEYFSKHILSPEIEDVPEIEEFLEKMNNLDDHGYFAPVFLFELMILGQKMLPGFERIRRRAIAEVKDFIFFLNGVATREPGEVGELSFIKKEIKVSFLLIARAEKVGLENIYLKRFGKELAKGCERVYVNAMGAKNISFAKTVSSGIVNAYDVEKVSEKTLTVITWRGGVTKGYICLFQPRS